MTFDVKKYVDELFDKGNKKKLKKHTKNIKKIRKKNKGNKKKGLKRQFKYMNKMVEDDQQKKGQKKKKIMSKRAIRMVGRMSDDAVNDTWRYTNGYANAYQVMHRLDRIENMLSNNKPLVQQQPKKHTSNIHTMRDWKK